MWLLLIGTCFVKLLFEIFYLILLDLQDWLRLNRLLMLIVYNMVWTSTAGITPITFLRGIIEKK